MKKVILCITAIIIAVVTQAAFCGTARADRSVGVCHAGFVTKPFNENIVCLALKDDDTLWAWADNREKNDGFELVKVADNVKSVYNYYYLTNDNKLWYLSELPDNITETCLIAEGVHDFCYSPCAKYIIKEDRSLWANGFNCCYGFMRDNDDISGYNDFIKLMNNTQEVAAGEYHTIVLKTDGSVWTFGINQCGQLGIGSYEDSSKKNKIMDNAKTIGAGVLSTFIIKSDDTLWSCGNYEYGGCIMEDNKLIPTYYIDNVKMVSNRYGDIIVLKTNGELWLYGVTADDYHENGDDKYPQKLMNNVWEISALTEEPDTTDILLIVTKNGELYRFNRTYEDGIGKIDITFITDGMKICDSSELRSRATAFADVAAKDPSYYEITALTNADIIQGVTDTEFMPDKPITRAEAAAVLLRLIGKGDAVESCDCSDVTEDKWYYGAVGASQKYGIISGYDDGTFRGEEPVSDIELAALEARALRREGTAPDTDEREITLPDSIPSWAAEDIAYAARYDIITQAEADALSGKSLTRGEAAVMLYSLYNVI